MGKLPNIEDIRPLIILLLIQTLVIKLRLDKSKLLILRIASDGIVIKTNEKVVLSNIYIRNKICKRDAKKQMREGDTILKINLTLQNSKYCFALSKQNLRTSNHL